MQIWGRLIKNVPPADRNNKYFKLNTLFWRVGGRYCLSRSPHNYDCTFLTFPLQWFFFYLKAIKIPDSNLALIIRVEISLSIQETFGIHWPINCFYCQLKFIKIFFLNQHYSKLHLSSPLYYFSSQCQQIFSSNSFLGDIFRGL